MSLWTRKLSFLLLALQILFLVLLAVLGKYERQDHADLSRYPYFQDVHIMIFVGFGFLMTFLKKYGYSATSFNMIIAAVAIQWALICQRFIHNLDTFTITFTAIIEADIAAAAVLISFGAVLGRLHPFQLIIMSLIEIVFYSLNFHIGVFELNALDAGGSIFIHTFGAYFGLAVACVVHKKYHVDHENASPVYHSDLFAMIGTLFLWICWPSFNAAIVGDAAGQYRAIVNTYLSLVSCTVVTCALSTLVKRHAKLDMVHLQNATLAGGVAVGAVANFMIQPFGALLLGAIAGAISVLGYDFVTPFLGNHLRSFDTCGVNNLHGMPGILSAVSSILAILFASEDSYGATDFAATFPKMVNGTDDGTGWSNVGQAGAQAAAFGITLVMAVVGGAITGFVLRLPFCGELSEDEVYDDKPFWEMPDGDEEKPNENGHELKHTLETSMETRGTATHNAYKGE